MILLEAGELIGLDEKIQGYPTRYIDAKEPIREKLLFPSPIRSRKGAYQLKTTLAIDSDIKRWVK